jgi:hypothetical protein
MLRALAAGGAAPAAARTHQRSTQARREGAPGAGQSGPRPLLLLLMLQPSLPRAAPLPPLLRLAPAAHAAR